MARYHQGWDELMKAANAALDVSLESRKAPEIFKGELPACMHCGTPDTGLTCWSCHASGQ